MSLAAISEFKLITWIFRSNSQYGDLLIATCNEMKWASKSRGNESNGFWCQSRNGMTWVDSGQQCLRSVTLERSIIHKVRKNISTRVGKNPPKKRFPNLASVETSLESTYNDWHVGCAR